MISIILPFKNAEPWIAETIDSILAQSYKDWELICINDHSTDSTALIVTGYSNKHENIQLLNNKEQGIIPALQLGLKSSLGKYITRMDADDLMPPFRLEKMLSAMESSPPKTIITGKVSYFSDSKISEGYNKYQKWLNDRVDHQDHYKHIYRECVVASPNWLARKKELSKFLIFDRLIYPEDYDMTFHWYSNDFKIVGLDEITLYWREHPQRTSRNSSTYDQDSFFKLKSQWFLKLNEIKNQSVAILGAGQKGKFVAQYLQKEDIHFNWYDLNHINFNNSVYGQSIKDPEKLSGDVIIVCIYPEKLNILSNYLESRGYSIGINAWYF